MIYVVARDIKAFRSFCILMSHAEDGKCRHTGKVRYRYVHRPETLTTADPLTDSIYMAFGWYERVDALAMIYRTREQIRRGTKVEGARLEYLATQQRRNQHTGARPRGYNRIRTVPGTDCDQSGGGRRVVR